jgi:8-oxo-dGTP diphosphatase
VQAIRRLRLAAYAICLRDSQILLARYLPSDSGTKYWTLPGGGVEHGEDPRQAVLREVEAETGYRIRVDRLLGVDSQLRAYSEPATELHHVSVIYGAEISGGELRAEIAGSTDLAAWISLAELPGLDRAVIIDTALALQQRMPPDGHVAPIPIGGLLRF